MNDKIVISECLCRRSSDLRVCKVTGFPTQAIGNDGNIKLTGQQSHQRIKLKISQNKFRQVFSYSVLVIFLLSLLACSEPNVSKLQGSTMGTSYSVLIPDLPKGVTEQTVQLEIESILERINQQMSTYQKDSELSLINQSAARQWLNVSPELFDVIQYAQSVSEQTAGAFDITVGPLVNLWGFGPPNSLDSVKPSEEQIARVRKQVGYKNLEIKQQGLQLRKQFSDLYIDLSAIAKGYGVDAVVAYLDSLSIQGYLVEIGGELRGKGLSQRGDYWRVALEKPEPGQRMVQRVIDIKDFAVATSGDYRNYFEKGGVRYSHTINPGTGRPISHALASVSVLSDEAMVADSWATALLVLGEQAGYKLAEEKGLAAYFIYRQGDEFLSKETSAFTLYIKNKE